ncbi:MAG: DUF2752 domain-containing protein [Flavobacteriales bacterium]|nr:DUF2752 domain-containing protein [Flavobacteriales bacterium]
MNFMFLSSWMIPCPSKKLLGIECPGCGTQRALELFFTQSPIEAIAFYPPILPLLIFAGSAATNLFVIKNNRTANITMITGAIYVAALIINFIIRHL